MPWWLGPSGPGDESKRRVVAFLTPVAALLSRAFGELRNLDHGSRPFVRHGEGPLGGFGRTVLFKGTGMASRSGQSAHVETGVVGLAVHVKEEAGHVGAPVQAGARSISQSPAA